MVSKFKAGKPQQRGKNSSLRYALEELKFLSSLHDLKIFYRNIAYLMPKTVDMITMQLFIP